MASIASSTEAETRRVADTYFEALDRHDLEGALAQWAPGARERLIGQEDLVAPDGLREFLGSMLRALPDASLEVAERVVQGDRACYRYVVRATFAGEPLQGVEATGAQVRLEGIDIFTIADGRIVAGDALLDMLSLSRQFGLVPPVGSRAERTLTRVFNLRTRLARYLAAARPQQVADGVWLVRGGFPGRTMNVYLVRDGSGVLLFDGGVRSMTRALATAGAQLGGITRVVLGHAHADHRGAIPGLGDIPVYVHEADRADAEGDGGAHYMDLSKLDRHGRLLLPRLARVWDGGPVRVTGTLQDGDDVAGFRVVHLPGHAPGLIALWRETDRVALVSDAFYNLDPQTGRKGPPRVPHVAFNWDTERARASIRKLAGLEPFAAFPGHAEPLKGDVRERLETAAATT
jgi:hydroxyacylglutathione hydrolase